MDQPEEPAPLPDLSTLSLAGLRRSDSPVLRAALARVLAELNDNADAVAGFQSSIHGPGA
jgi:FXSXX-COOH protein